MKLTIPYKVRATLYIINVIGTPVIMYLLAKDIIGQQEVMLWGAEMTAVSIMAALNIDKTKEL